jgi:hypothetical protein
MCCRTTFDGDFAGAFEAKDWPENAITYREALISRASRNGESWWGKRRPVKRMRIKRLQN